MLYEKEEPPITFMDDNALKECLNSFYVLKLSIEMPYYQGGHNIWLKLYYQVLKLYSKHSHISAKTVSSTFLILCCLGGCGSAAPGERQSHPVTATLKWPLETEGYLYLFLSSTTALSSSPTVQTDEKQQVLISLSLYWHTLSSQATPLISTINPWEKRCQNSIREQLHWFPILKEHLVHVLADGCVCYSWSLAPSRLERRPVSFTVSTVMLTKAL
jgi:hypothetical protein